LGAGCRRFKSSYPDIKTKNILNFHVFNFIKFTFN
jgi:hypothetical protein